MITGISWAYECQIITFLLTSAHFAWFKSLFKMAQLLRILLDTSSVSHYLIVH